MALKLQNIKKISLDGKIIIKDFSMTAYPGETIWIEGPKGSGKSLVLKMIYGMVLPDEGEIEVLGQDLKKLKPSKLYKIRRNIGFVPQEPRALFSRKVIENLLFVSEIVQIKKNKKEKIEEALSTFGLSSLKENRVYELSSKEKTLLMFSMALIKDPLIYLVDEVHWEKEEEIKERVCSLCEKEIEKGKLLIFATSGYKKIFDKEKLIKLQ